MAIGSNVTNVDVYSNRTIRYWSEWCQLVTALITTRPTTPLQGMPHTTIRFHIVVVIVVFNFVLLVCARVHNSRYGQLTGLD